MKLNENTTVTLTIGQLKKLVMESKKPTPGWLTKLTGAFDDLHNASEKLRKLAYSEEEREADGTYSKEEAEKYYKKISKLFGELGAFLEDICRHYSDR